MNTTKTCSPLKILFAVAGSTYSHADEKLVTGIPWPGGTTTRVLTVMRGGVPFVGLRTDGNGVAQETFAAICMQEWAAAEVLVGRVANRQRASDLSTEALVCDGSSSEAILRNAEAVSADLIAISARGLNAPGEFRLGATAGRLAYGADCSVLVVRPPAVGQRLLLATDGSPAADKALGCLTRWPWPLSVTVTVLHVRSAVAPPRLRRTPVASEEIEEQAKAQAIVERAVERLHAANLPADGQVAVGDPATEVLRSAQCAQSDLILVGARRLNAVQRILLGSVSSRVARFAPRSVLVMR